MTFYSNYYYSNDPKIISNGGGDYAKIHVFENNTFVTDVETYDTISTEENGRLTYKIIGGWDKDKFDIDSKTGVLSFKNAPDFENPTDYYRDNDYHVKVKVIDGAGYSDTQYIEVVVKDVNEAPHANNDHVSVDEGQMVVIDVLANDTDPDGDPLSIDSVANPANGTAEIVDGEIKYTPDAGFTGDETFEYTVSDGNGGTDTATVKVTVNDVNEAPHANNDHVSVDEGQMVVIDVLANDTDPDGDPLSIDSVANPANGTAEIVDGEIKYTPDAGFTGDETFEYTVSDGNGGTDTATVKVTVNDVNEAPHANNDHVSVDEGQMVVIDVLANDTDPDGDPLSIDSVANPANGTAEIVDGEIKYTPDAGFTGDETFEYTVSDGNGGTDTATVKVTVNDVNEAPHANNDHVSVDEGQMVVIDVLANDTDPDGDPLSIDSVANPANGTAEIVDGEIKYTPDAGFTGDETFEYTVSDGNGGTDTATVKVTVNDVGEDPILGDGKYLLKNHPDGKAPGPGYGLRLDGLLTGDETDIFTFDFEDPDSKMFMSIENGGSQISISGTVYGGLVDPLTQEYDPHQSGLWSVDFTYTNVENLPDDDDLIVDDALAGNSTGQIKQMFGHREIIPLEDYAGQNANTFQLGDLEDDGGFRGFSGVSGWGWLQAGDNYLEASDWLFTVGEAH